MFRILESGVNSVIEMEVKGDVTKDDYERLEEAIKEKLKETDKVNILCKITELSSITAKAILADFKIGVKHYRNINRMAVVSAKEWIEWWSKLGAILPVEIKHFNTDEIDQAWNWIKDK